MKIPVRHVLELLVGVAVITGAVIWLSGGLGDRVPAGKIEHPAEGRPPDGVATTVELRHEPAVEWATGSLASARHTAVASRILARIEALRVAAGDEVAEDDELVVLDARDLQARVEQVREALRGARAELDFARTEKGRTEELLKKGVTTRQRFDQAVSAFRVAEAAVDRLKRSLEEAMTALSYTVIRAPVAGRVVDRLAEPGDMASPGQPLLRIYDPRVLRVEVPVRESLAVRLAVGQGLGVEVSALGAVVDGVIDEIVPLAETGARTLLVKVRLPSDPGLFAGMFARVAVPAGRRSRLVLPAAAVERIGQLEFVTVLGRDEQPERRLVTSGEIDAAGGIEILSGLAEGERVLLPPAAEAAAPSAF
jgi:RND family efflux transporter MFP subunit